MQVNRNYQKKVTKYTDTVDQEFIHQIINWLYSITNNVETESEENDSMEKLHQYIDMQHSSGLVSDALINFTADYITKSYVPWLRFLSGARYTRTFCGHFADTGFVESENAQLVKNPFAPTPNNNLNTTCDKLLLMSDNRFRVLKRNDTASFLSHTTKQMQRHLDNSLQVALSSSLSDLSAKKILEEYEARESKCWSDL